MQTRLARLVVFLATLCPLLSMAGATVPPVTTVILVRHAEKTVSGPMSADVPLSEAGLTRANELARVLSGAGITAVYTTPYARTRSTAGPIASKLGLEPIEVDAGGGYADALAKELLGKQAGKTVLVVGHSNTTPQLIRKLGGVVSDIGDSEYDNLYVVTIAGSSTSVVRLHYGASSQAP
jgi:broad specificity phosphatase PhoE